MQLCTICTYLTAHKKVVFPDHLFFTSALWGDSLYIHDDKFDWEFLYFTLSLFFDAFVWHKPKSAGNTWKRHSNLISYVAKNTRRVILQISHKITLILCKMLCNTRACEVFNNFWRSPNNLQCLAIGNLHTTGKVDFTRQPFFHFLLL